MIIIICPTSNMIVWGCSFRFYTLLSKNYHFSLLKLKIRQTFLKKERPMLWQFLTSWVWVGSFKSNFVWPHNKFSSSISFFALWRIYSLKILLVLPKHKSWIFTNNHNLLELIYKGWAPFWSVKMDWTV